jgi:hypothetical protein
MSTSTDNILLEIVKSDILRIAKGLFPSGDSNYKKEMLNVLYNISLKCNLDVANYIQHIGAFEVFLYFCEFSQGPDNIQISLTAVFSLLNVDDCGFFVQELNRVGAAEKFAQFLNHKNEFIHKQVSAISYFFEMSREIIIN